MYRSISLLSSFLIVLPSHSFPSSPSLPPFPSPVLPCAPLPSSPPSLPSLPQWLHVKGSQGTPQSWRHGVPHCSVVVGEVEVHRSLRREWSLPPGTTNTLHRTTHTTAHHTSQNSLARRYTCTYVCTSVPPGTYVQVLGIYADTVRSIRRVSLAC